MKKSPFLILMLSLLILLSPFRPVHAASNVRTAPVSRADGYAALAESERYFNDLTLFDEAFDYFVEIASSAEYGNQSYRFKRWEEPLVITLEGDYSKQDLDTLKSLLAWHHQIAGMPDFQFSSKAANYRFLFHPLDRLYEEIADMPEDNWGIAYIWWDEAGRIYQAETGIAIDVADQYHHNHLILEEFTQSLGLLVDSYTYEDSIFQQAWTEVQTLSPLDFAIVRMFYSPAINMNMDTEQMYDALRAYYGLP